MQLRQKNPQQRVVCQVPSQMFPFASCMSSRPLLLRRGRLAKETTPALSEPSLGPANKTQWIFLPLAILESPHSQLASLLVFGGLAGGMTIPKGNEPLAPCPSQAGAISPICFYHCLARM